MNPLELANKGNIKIINIKKLKPFTKEGFLYIGRQNDHMGLNGSKWGNPIHLKREADRLKVLGEHEAYLRTREELMNALKELENQTLGCYCCNYSKETGFQGKMCHGLNLIKLYDEFVDL